MSDSGTGSIDPTKDLTGAPVPSAPKLQREISKTRRKLTATQKRRALKQKRPSDAAIPRSGNAQLDPTRVIMEESN
jgi:hypothetical protein